MVTFLTSPAFFTICLFIAVVCLIAAMCSDRLCNKFLLGAAGAAFMFVFAFVLSMGTSVFQAILVTVGVFAVVPVVCGLSAKVMDKVCGR